MTKTTTELKSGKEELMVEGLQRDQRAQKLSCTAAWQRRMDSLTRFTLKWP